MKKESGDERQLRGDSILGWQRFLQQRFLQMGLVIACGIYIWGLHRDNDGLWYPDATRHAANGVFWKEIICNPTLDPKGYALSYYARYPVISPASRAPLFYWIEAAAFGLTGPDPYVAKVLVLLFSVAGGLIALAWLRQWVSSEAGWAAGLFVLAPGVVQWSNAVMLNVPCTAIGFGMLYCARARATSTDQRSSRRWMVLLFVAALATVGMYFLGIVLVGLALLWTVMTTGVRRNIIWIIVLGCLLVPILAMVRVWAPDALRWITPDLASIGRCDTYAFYLRKLPLLFGTYLVVLAVAGGVLGCLQRTQRGNTLALISWIVFVYLVLSVISAHDARYLLFIAPPVVLLGTTAIVVLVDWMQRCLALDKTTTRWIATVAIFGVMVVYAMQARFQAIPKVSGIRAATDFYREIAPNEPILFDGRYGGNFTFYTCAADPGFRRQVVRGDKLLYSYRMHETNRLREYVRSVDEVVHRIRKYSGCRVIAVEKKIRPDTIRARQLLREAVKGPEFEWLGSRPLRSTRSSRIDFYRITGPVDSIDSMEIPFPGLGKNVKMRLSPVKPR